MTPVRFEPTIAAGEQPRTYAVDRAATRTGTAVHVINTKKELDKNTPEMNQRFRTLIKDINYHQILVDRVLEDIRQELGQTKEGLNSSVESVANNVRTVSAALQAEKQSSLSEFKKINVAVSCTEVKNTVGLATQT
jgi:uncharacterized protein YoxC